MGGMSLGLIERVRRRGAAGGRGRLRRLADLRSPRGPVAAALRARVRGCGAPVERSRGSRPTSIWPAAGRFLFLSDVLRREAGALDRRFAGGRGRPPGPRPRAVPRGAPRALALASAVRGADRSAQGDRHRDRGAGAAARRHAHRRRKRRRGGHEAELRELAASARRRGAGSRSRTCPGPSSRTAYADADAVVFPVRWEEPWGLVPLEAMVVGTPVVATGAGGSGEYLERRTELPDLRPRRRAPPRSPTRVRELAADADAAGTTARGRASRPRGASAPRASTRGSSARSPRPSPDPATAYGPARGSTGVPAPSTRASSSPAPAARTRSASRSIAEPSHARWAWPR